LGKIGIKNEKATLDKRRTTAHSAGNLKRSKDGQSGYKRTGGEYRWRDRALQGISETFSNKKRNNQANSDAERERLLKIIGEQACVIDTLKKIQRCSHDRVETKDG